MITKIYRQVTPTLTHGFYIESTSPLTPEELNSVRWLVAETFEPEQTGGLKMPLGHVLEIGPRLSIETPFSSNAVSSCCSFTPKIIRMERTECYLITAEQTEEKIIENNLDRMTQQVYPTGINTFDIGIIPEPSKIIDVLCMGISVLEEANQSLGLGMDPADIEYYRHLFIEKLKRNPTCVELFQLGNANSEHSRHWFFKGLIVIDEVPMKKSLLEIVQEPLLKLGPVNRTLAAFNDNAGVLRGFETTLLVPTTPGYPSELELTQQTVHFAATAETHNHPTCVEPFAGAETGAGGRIRDNSAVGRGAIPGIGIAGYAVGNLFIPGYEIPGEIIGRDKPSTYASPLEILIKGSDGVSSYGNKFGEPLTLGFVRTFGQIINDEWREFRKSILYTGGISHVWDGQVTKHAGQVGMHIVRIGGPAYPIGVGGGAASSMMQGQNTDELDFASVQRGNAEMENKANRVIRACVEMGVNNPISSIHDQGAGGPSNVLTELMEPLGGKVDIRKIRLGDKTMSVLQIWSAEFQEGYGFLIKPEHLELFKFICERERVNCEVVGVIDGKRKVVVVDSENDQTVVDLNLEQILTKMPRKTFKTSRRAVSLPALNLPATSLREDICAVFKLPHVGSKGHLVHKVDRSVTGLVAAQQCCGLAQIPIADNTIIAQSHFSLTGCVAAVGENSTLMLIDPKAGARMAVAEMLTNMASVKITDLADVRMRANWMWPAKLPHEGADLYDAACAMSDLMIKLGIAIDGGKDSLSMAARVCNELVKSPGSLVILGYAPVPDITKKVTPDIKHPGKSMLGLIDLGLGQNRLGGSALAQVHNQLGNACPDVDDELLFANTIRALQKMIEKGLILSMHDRSGGGLITTVTEMCMASRCGFKLDIDKDTDAQAVVLNEELGFVIEFSTEQQPQIEEICALDAIPFAVLGSTLSTGRTCSVHQGNRELFNESMTTLRLWFERTSYEIEKIKITPECATSEYDGLKKVQPSINEHWSYRLSFQPEASNRQGKDPEVAILREEGTNGDREMAAACKAAGLRPTIIRMSDLIAGDINLDKFQVRIFPGGFSYMDVFDSAKGWAGAILFNPQLKEMFDRFDIREDTLSLGICNGAQLMALLGLVPGKGLSGLQQPRFVHNVSGRFESRWSQVEILHSPSILLSGMAGSKLGVWNAHAEGRLVFPDSVIEEEVRDKKLVSMAFVNPFGERTEEYPHNPNGSALGSTALCSPNGRNLAMMPHPERCFLNWQWPWIPASWNKHGASPWLRMFQNARRWCLNNQA